MEGALHAVLVTVTGGAGAGKTTVADALASRSGDVAVVHLDDYYHFADRDRGVWVADADGVPRLDVGDPRSIDFGRADRAVSEGLTTSTVVVVEGLFAIDVLPAQPCARLDVFLDLAADLRLARKIYRKCVRGDFPVESLLTNYLNHRRDAHDRHVEPARDRCDLVLDGRRSADHLATRIRHALDATVRLT